MRTGRCALSSCTAAGKTHTYCRMGGRQSQCCRGSLGWPDLGTFADLSVALCCTQEEGGTAGKHREDRGQKISPLFKREGFKRKPNTKKIYHDRDKARL